MSSERGYLDGVPLRLSTKFAPIPRMQFREIDIHIPIDALQEDYDFSLERSALAEAKEWELQKRLRAERESQERLQREKEEIERLADSILKSDAAAAALESSKEDDSETSPNNEDNIVENSKGGSCETTEESHGGEFVPIDPVSSGQSNESVPKEDTNISVNLTTPTTVETSQESCPAVPSTVPPEYFQTYCQDIAGPVLQPQPQLLHDDYESKMCSNSRTMMKDSDRSYHMNAPMSKMNLNLSDFESDTANPFDNVELKSINDMEVLAAVLKNNSMSAVTSVPQNQEPGRTVNMNYMNGMGYNSEQNPMMYYPQSSYPNQNYPNPNQWTPSQYYPIVPISSAPGDLSHNHTMSASLETPVITQSQISSQSNPPHSVNSFTRFYFPLLTSMANSRANRDRNSPYGVVPDIYSTAAPPITTLQPPNVPQLVNQNPISTPTPAIYGHNSVQQRHPISQSPTTLYWPDGRSHTPVPPNPYNLTSSRLSTPYQNDTSTTPSVNPNPSFQNAPCLSTSPKGSHPTLQ